MSDLIQDGELHLYGFVGGSSWWDDGFSSGEVRQALRGLEGPLTVRLNSSGGIATEGIAIFNILSDYEDQVTIKVEALAASAASVIAMAADDLVMKTGSMLMIHDPSGLTWGTAEEHRSTADGLDTIADSAVQIYQSKSDMSAEDIRELMRKETWLGADDAVEDGFADRVEGKATMALRPFDYTLFKHVPEHLVMPTPRKPAEVSGLPKMEASMAGKTAKAGVEPGKTNPTPDPVLETPEPTPASAPKAPDNKPAEMSRADQNKLKARAQQAGLSADDTLKIVMEATDLDGGLEMIFATLEQKSPEPTAPKGPTTMIVRDERETRREGLQAALSARMSGVDPDTDKAHRYMEMTLPEMAATAVQQKDIRLMTFAQREQALMAGFHATSDFPAIFENVLNKSLLERYQTAEPTYRAISRQRNFRDFRPHSMVRPGDFPRLQTLGQGGEIKMGTFGENKETAIARPYAVQFAISREMMVNDDLGAIDEVLADQGGEVANFEERTFYGFMLATTTKLSDGKVVHHADHGNLASSGSAITVASVGAGRKAMRKQRSIAAKAGDEGRLLNVTAKILLVSPDKETEAEQLVATVQPNQSDQVNPFSGKLQVISPAELTGNAWYLFADPSRLANYVWGLLDGYEAPRARIDEPFGVQGMGFSLEHDWGFGATDHRGTWKDPGA